MSWYDKEAHGGPVPVEHTNGPEELLEAYFEEASGAISRNTERALRSDVHVFTTWCRGRRTTPFPASPKTLVPFIDEMTASRTPATVRRYVSSITTVQKKLGETSPLENASVRFALQRMHRRRGRRQTQVHGLTWPLRNRLLNAAGDRLIDARNRALLGVGYDTLLRRSELVALRVEDVLEEMDGSATVLLRAGKTDAEGCGTSLFLARDTRWPDSRRAGQCLAPARPRGRRSPLPRDRTSRKAAREARRQPSAPHLQADGPTGGTTGRDRRGTGRPQHAGRRGTGHDRLRHRAARDPAVRPLEDHPHGPALRRTAAGQTQRRRPARRTPETLTLSRGFETRSGGA